MGDTAFQKRLDEITRDAIKRSQEVIAAEMARHFGSSDQQIAWLLEMPGNDNSPPRWFNPDTGWMIDANRAMWFARRQDAESYKRSSRGMVGGDIVSTEHVFIGNPLPNPVEGGN